MAHLKIAYYFLVLLVGAAAIAYAALMSRAYRLPFLKPLAWFLGFNNGLALINLTSAYACANLLGFCAIGQYTVLAGILRPAARLFQLGIIFALFAIVRAFSGRRLSRAFKRSFGIAAGLLLASYVVTGLLPRGSALWIWIVRAQLVVFVLGILAILRVLLSLVLDSRKIRNSAERKAIRLFGFSYLVIYAVFVATFWLPDAVQFPPNALALLAINLFPLIWFRKPFAEAYAATAASADDRESLERFCRTRGLTSREANILELILRGKSNAQIEKELFISIHTVKNHITNIHQKLGVRSRWQLISLFHSSPQSRPSAEPPVIEMQGASRNGLRPQ
ncbi:MAG: helix-turn-helix transcriptional regulator [Candidatus Aminicenantales bacterium]